MIFFQYVRVMQPNTQCTSDGPFFPATTSNIVANGISITTDLLQQPDWAVIFILLACAVLVMVIMIFALVSFIQQKELGFTTVTAFQPKHVEFFSFFFIF